MSFPTTGILDNFNRADQQPLSSSWSQFDSYSRLAVVSNQCAALEAGGSYGLDYYNVAQYGADCEAYVTLAVLPSVALELGLRHDVANSNGYYVKYTNAASDTIQVYRMDAGVSTQLGATITQDFAAGDTLGFEAIGSILTVYRKPSGGAWAALGSRTDTTYSAAGYLWLEMDDITGRSDDFGGGTVVAAAGFNPAWVAQNNQILGVAII